MANKLNRRKNKGSNIILELIAIILKLLFHIILLPFKILMNCIYRLMKRLKFSITLKITASYFLLYIVIIFIVTITTSIGYFLFTLNEFKNNTVANEIEFIQNNIDNTDLINELLTDKNIKNINLYDEDYSLIYTWGLNSTEQKYTNNIIINIEKIITEKIYIFSKQMNVSGKLYYINIYYRIDFLLTKTFYNIVVIFISGIFGLLLFAPIVSGTSSKLIKPIKNMTEIAKTISVNNINTRIDIKDTQDELKELSMTFNDMMDRIEEGYKSQQQFVSDASHELRTPIAVIKGYVNMLDRWGKDDREVLNESITAIKNEADSMQDLIEKLLFIARSDKQTLQFNKEDFIVSEMFTEIEKETQMIDKKHIFKFRFTDDANVYADKNRIKQAIRIFIDNAIKFTPENGTITIIGYLSEQYYAISIKDTGIGIKKEDLSKIFDRLYRAEESRNKQIGGYGLGLSIAKIIILGHKGKIKVKSTFGVGSEFTILLPRL